MLNKLLLSLSLLFTSTLMAAPVCDHPLSLTELVDIALENNPETRQAWWSAQRAAAAVGIAQSAYYPKVSLNTHASHGRDLKFINGPDTNYTLVGSDLVLSMLLYDFGERCNAVNAAQLALLSADWQANWAFQRVMVRVLENAYATLYAQEALQAILTTRDEVETLLRTAQELNRVGLTPVSDVYTSQATLSQTMMEVAQHKAMLDIQRAKLAISLGLDAETPLQLLPIQELPVVHKQKTAELIAFAKTQRADLMASQARLASLQAREQQVAASYRPKLSLGARGGADYAFHKKEHGGNYQIALRLEIPLFDGFENCYQQRLARADSYLTAEEILQLELNISLEVLTHSRSLDAAQEMLGYADSNLSESMQAYQGVLEKYKAGKERMAEVSIAQRQLAHARLRHSDVKTRLLVAMANLAFSTGTFVPCTEILP
ncbi:MAG: TolC family protein [Parachlamydiaceae bacterium]|nr:TolC family protein [Parachlamydiaceae bacterium]